MTHAILGAMDAEVSGFIAALDRPIEDSRPPFKFYRGRLAGKDVAVSKSGVGKTLSAMVAQGIIDAYAPKSIIFTGLAGALSAALDIGDVVVARDCLQHDVDARELGFARGEIPFTSFRAIPCSQAMIAAAATYRPSSGKLVVGRVLTGDQFVGGTDLETRAYLRDELGGDAVEMEGASVGLVAASNGIPFVLVRTISDRADGSAHADFEAFLPKASVTALELVTHLLAALD